MWQLVILCYTLVVSPERRSIGYSWYRYFSCNTGCISVSDIAAYDGCTENGFQGVLNSCSTETIDQISVATDTWTVYHNWVTQWANHRALKISRSSQSCSAETINPSQLPATCLLLNNCNNSLALQSIQCNSIDLQLKLYSLIDAITHLLFIWYNNSDDLQ